jgi:tetratricopeptide (TPR) repeat protein
MADREYAAFLSYSSADREVARRMQRALESYSVPKSLRGKTTGFGLIGERLGKICRDRTDFKSGESLNAAILEALDKSYALVVLCSPASAASKWVNAEIEHFKKLGRAARIYPVIVAADETGRVVNSFPPALLRPGSDEPIAADLQPQSDGWTDGVLKIIASVLEVDFDALRQRELKAARRRMRVAYSLAGAFAAIASVAIGLGVFAARQRDVALESFEKAVAITADSAERTLVLTDRTDVPRTVISGFLKETEADLGGLSAIREMNRHPRLRLRAIEEKLLFSDLYAEIGRSREQLEAARAAQRAFEDFAAEFRDPARRFAAAALFQEKDANLEFDADLLSAIIDEASGKARAANGDLKGALASFERCRLKRREFLNVWETDEEESARIRSDALKCGALQADALTALGAPGAALALLEPMLGEEGAAPHSQNFARTVLAEIYADTGRLGKAIALLDAAIGKGETAADGRYEKMALARLRKTRARAVAFTGGLDAALADLDAAEGLLAEFLRADGADRSALLLRAELLSARGEARALAGKRDLAEEDFFAGLAILDNLVEFDAARRDWRLQRAAMRNARAENALRRFESDTTDAVALARAERMAEGALLDTRAVFTESRSAERDEIAARLQLSSQIILARALRLGGEVEKARTILAGAAASLADEDRAGAGAAAHALRAAMIADEFADLAAETHDFEGARRHFNDAITRYEAYIAREPAAALVVRDLIWSQMASAKAMRDSGDAVGARRRLVDACARRKGASLSEYSLFVRDAGALAALAAEMNVGC